MSVSDASAKNLQFGAIIVRFFECMNLNYARQDAPRVLNDEEGTMEATNTVKT